MKKTILAIAMVASACTANAQTNLNGSKLTDNWSIGIQGGVFQPTTGQNIIKDSRAAFNIDIQKQITPIFGIGVNYTGMININNTNSKTDLFGTNGIKTAVDYSNLSANGLINLNNLFCGYKGQPQFCEVVARAGMGWGYIYGSCYGPNHDNNGDNTLYFNAITANFGVDVNFNISDAWAINVKPSITYIANNQVAGLDVNSSYVQLLAGITYKFKNSNGTHHFTLNDKQYSQSQMDEMNARINAEIAAKAALQNAVENNAKTIKALQDELAAEKAKEKTVTVVNNTTTTQLAPVVIYGLGKKTIDATQRPNVAMIATYMKNHPEVKVRIQGYASPEGNPELNQKLSDARAQAVYDMLVNTYGISKDRLEAKGMGVTDELFDENDWNRVATFIETTPKKTTTTTTTK